MAHLRFKALDQLATRPKIHVELPSTKISDFFGENVFTVEEMRALLAPAVFKRVSVQEALPFSTYGSEGFRYNIPSLTKELFV